MKSSLHPVEEGLRAINISVQFEGDLWNTLANPVVCVFFNCHYSQIYRS